MAAPVETTRAGRLIREERAAAVRHAALLVADVVAHPGARSEVAPLMPGPATFAHGGARKLCATKMVNMKQR